MNQATHTIKRPRHRRISLAAGALYLLTFVSIPTIALYSNAKDTGFIASSIPATPILIGAALEVIVAIAGISTAVVLYGILRKQSNVLATGLVASRTLEGAGIIVGVAFLLSIVALRDTGVGPEGLVVGSALSTLYSKMFLLSQSLMPGFNDLILGYLLYQSNLVPRFIARIGMVGGPLLVVGFLMVILGFAEQNGTVAGLSALPVAAFELILGLWLVFKGFNPKAAEDLEASR